MPPKKKGELEIVRHLGCYAVKTPKIEDPFITEKNTENLIHEMEVFSLLGQQRKNGEITDHIIDIIAQFVISNIAKHFYRIIFILQ